MLYFSKNGYQMRVLMKRLFSQLFKQAIVLLFWLASVFFAQAMINNVSEIKYVNNDNDKNKTIVIFGYSSDSKDNRFMGLNAQKKHLKSFFDKYKTEDQKFDLFIQKNVNLSEEYGKQYKHSFFYDFYKTTNTFSSYNCKIETFDKTRKCIAQKIRTKFYEESNDSIICKLSDLQIKDNENDFSEVVNKINEDAVNLMMNYSIEIEQLTENIKIALSSDIADKIYNIEKLILSFDLMSLIDNKIKTNENDTILVHCQDDCRSKVVEYFEKQKKYNIENLEFDKFFNDSSEKASKNETKIPWYKKIGSRLFGFVGKHKPLFVVGSLAFLGVAYYYFQYLKG